MLQFAFLRGVNVAGKNKVSMAELRQMLSDLGFPNPRTLLQSGNLIFEADRTGSELEAHLETETEQRLGLRTQFMVRNHAELEALVAANPFPDEAKNDPSHLVVVFLKSAPKEGGLAELQAAIKGREIVRAHGNHVYAVYPDGIGDSKLTPAQFDGKLGTKGTGRNWNTVMKRVEMGR
jgi:uncharacterized protein (DUF1697 family)